MKAWPKVALGDLFDIEKGKIGIMAATPGEFPLVTTGEEFSTHFEPHFAGCQRRFKTDTDFLQAAI